MLVSMSDLKTETFRFAYSLVFFGMVLLMIWFLYPKMLERGAKAQSAAFWKQEREQNEKRLFGGEE